MGADSSGVCDEKLGAHIPSQLPEQQAYSKPKVLCFRCISRTSVKGEACPHMAPKCTSKDNGVPAVNMPTKNQIIQSTTLSVYIVYMKFTKACRVAHNNCILRVVLVLSLYSVTHTSLLRLIQAHTVRKHHCRYDTSDHSSPTHTCHSHLIHHGLRHHND